MPIAKKSKSSARSAKRPTAKKKTAARKSVKKRASAKASTSRASAKASASKATAKRTTKTAAKKKTTAKAAKRSTATGARRTTASATARSGSKAAASRKRVPNAAFMAPMQPDGALSPIVGNRPLPRTQVTKKIWSYIKRHDLQDADRRTVIVADDNLRQVFNGKRRIDMFQMTKLINQHLIPIK